MDVVQPHLTSPFGAAPAGTPILNSTLQNAQAAYLTAEASTATDGVKPTWWSGIGSPGQTIAGGDAIGGDFSRGGFFGVMQNLMGQLDALIAQFSGGSSAGATASQNVAKATFASVGDPHLSETGTLANGAATSAVNRHFDSMTSHDDLLDSADFTGGYRLSTTVTSPSAKGITMNQSATITLNGGADSISLQNDGSYSVTSNGQTVALEAGAAPTTLAGGEQVQQNRDGSLLVSVSNDSGGAISTKLAVNAGGVDATATVSNAAVGGDIAAGSSSTSARVPLA